MASYHRASDGEWIQPKRRGYKMMCCDCGLVHTLNFKLVEYGGGRHKIRFQAFRNERSTALARRGNSRRSAARKKISCAP